MNLLLPLNCLSAHGLPVAVQASVAANQAPLGRLDGAPPGAPMR